MVGIAVSQPENDNCILRNDAGITRDNLAQLAGHKIATRLGSVSHFRLLKLLERLDIDQSRIEIVASADGASAAQALQQGDVVMACAAGSSLRRMAEYGQPLLSGAELESIGLRLFDAITVPTVFMDEHPEIVQAFVDIIEASNQQWRKNPGPMRAAIARAANMHQEASDRAMQGFSFPLNQEQKSAAWLGDAVPVYLQELADFFVKQGQLDKAMESYEPFITTRFLR
jgi:taurine transport system substrate-binding protein